MLALECVRYAHSIPSGVRYVPKMIRSSKGVWRYLQVDGHEHISLMPFFML